MAKCIFSIGLHIPEVFANDILEVENLWFGINRISGMLALVSVSDIQDNENILQLFCIRYAFWYKVAISHYNKIPDWNAVLSSIYSPLHHHQTCATRRRWKLLWQRSQFNCIKWRWCVAMCGTLNCVSHMHTVQCPSGGRAHKELSQLFSAPCAIYYITSIMKEPDLKNLFSL